MPMPQHTISNTSAGLSSASVTASSKRDSGTCSQHLPLCNIKSKHQPITYEGSLRSLYMLAIQALKQQSPQQTQLRLCKTSCNSTAKLALEQ